MQLHAAVLLTRLLCLMCVVLWSLRSGQLVVLCIFAELLRNHHNRLGFMYA